jgi:hypothetical protein
VDDPVLELVRPTFADGVLDALVLVGMDDAGEGADTVADEVRGRIAGDLLDRIAHELHRPLGIVRAAEDGAGDVGDERPEAFLALSERLLRRLGLRDVEHVALPLDRAAGGVADDDVLVAEPDDPPVPGEQAVLADEGLVRRERAPVLGEGPLAILRMEHLDPAVWRARPFLRRVAEDPLDLRAHVGGRAEVVEVVDVDGERELLDERPELALAVAEPVDELRQAPLEDEDDAARHRQRADGHHGVRGGQAVAVGRGEHEDVGGRDEPELHARRGEGVEEERVEDDPEVEERIRARARAAEDDAGRDERVADRAGELEAEHRQPVEDDQMETGPGQREEGHADDAARIAPFPARREQADEGEPPAGEVEVGRRAGHRRSVLARIARGQVRAAPFEPANERRGEPKSLQRHRASYRKPRALSLCVSAR